MESTQLSNFYRTISQWPKTSMEMNVLADALSGLLQAPFVAAYLMNPEGGEEKSLSPKLGFRCEDPKLANLPTLPVIIEDFLGKHIHSASPLSSHLKQVQVSGDFLGGQHLGFVPVITREGSVHKNHGWIVAAYPRAFSAKEEVLILAAAQRLVELSEIDHLDSEIQLRSQFLSIASHELKTPLTAIYGMLQLQERAFRLRRNDPAVTDPERQLSYIRRMLRQVERLNELIDGLLDISRIQNNRFMVEPSETDVAAVVREAISSRLDQVASEANVTLHVEAPDSFIAWVDPVRLEEVITNLTMNAIRFSPEGGAVWIRLKTDSDSFHLTVRDQGPSVPIEDRERIFKPFERAQRTARLGGLGLGLFISRQIAQLHGGTVALVESVPGKGNVFEAYFPMRAAAQPLVSAS